ncbi:hypothetical protein NCCP28_06240 [Niallia sp. NCCP-28]|nr:hypothetical protein NCCP28_06240 [Niallia sp. NCCP-28]
MCSICGGKRVLRLIDSYSIRTTPCPLCPPETAEERDKRLAPVYQALEQIELKMLL